MGCIPNKKENVPSSSITRRFSANTMAIYKDFNVLSHQYIYKELLGRGRFGRVILGESPESHQQVAIKVLPKEKTSMIKLMKEVDILSEVDHPNIVKYMKHYETAKYLYIVMEYCPGGDLFQKVVKQDKFTELEATKTMEEILRAINHCHHLGIIHRDLKPENIMYSSEGILKIIDFGLSMKENTRSDEMVAGTACYISPEILKDEKFTKACDIWSLGVVLYVLLSGYLPFEGSSFEEVSENIKSYTGLAFSYNRWNGISSHAKDLIRKMLDPNCETRITASDALNHPWFGSSNEEKSNFNSKVMDALKRYSEFSKLKKQVLNLIVKNINDEELKEFQQTFLELDKNKTGMITHNDLEEGLKKSGDEITVKELEELTRKVNYNGDAFINYSSFIAALVATHKFMTEEKIISLFKVLEVEQGICITDDSRKSSPNNKVYPEDETKINEKINFEEFKKMLWS